MAVRCGTARPAPLRSGLAVAEVQVLVRDVAVLLRQREVARNGKRLGAFRLEFFDRREPLVLMHGVSREQEAQEVAHAVIVGHVIETRDLHPALHLGVGIGGEVREQIAARGDVRALPGVAVAVDGARSRTRDDALLHISAPDDRGDRRIVLHGILGDAQWRLLEQLGDHDREHLDVSHLLRPDAEDQVTVLAGDVHVPCLELILHGHGDLAVLAAQNLLKLSGVDGIRGLGCRRVLEFLTMEERGCLSERIVMSGP
ncbi:hypothetical protein RN50_00636 [Microbacterium foliorum]|uniref:Uncharacterized protein n=1 Tax=Microbacterium foliorum TaxID=104336 RepID=A0A0F0KZL2_9MICO|nr:hypothetical protein RN50_00636 [Microbacterium foliorum]